MILEKLFSEQRMFRIGRVWSVLIVILSAFYIANQFRVGWTDGAGHPFGEDFLNFWSAARLSLSQQTSTIYDLAAFHHFQEVIVGAPIDLYHYSYPPVSWLLFAPFGLLPYPLGWAFWQGAGWLAFALAVRQAQPNNWVLLAFATPAVFINALAGQNGCWIAAALGGGLLLLRHRPILAGFILSLLVIKPQLGWMLPLALLAAGQWRSLAALAVSGFSLLFISVLLFGFDSWLAYAHQAALLKSVVLESGTGTWHRMLSVFVLVRHAGASVSYAYAAQVVASMVAAALVARLWYKQGITNGSCAALILGVLAGSLYVSDYDLVMVTLACALLWPTAILRERLILALAMVTPLFAAPIALDSGLAIGVLPIWMAFVSTVFSQIAKSPTGKTALI